MMQVNTLSKGEKKHILSPIRLVGEVIKKIANIGNNL